METVFLLPINCIYILYQPFGLHHSHHMLAHTANATTIVPLFPIYIRYKTTLIIEQFHIIIYNFIIKLGTSGRASRKGLTAGYPYENHYFWAPISNSPKATCTGGMAGGCACRVRPPASGRPRPAGGGWPDVGGRRFDCIACPAPGCAAFTF